MTVTRAARSSVSAKPRTVTSPLLYQIIALMVFISPFNGALSVAPLGELGHEAYAMVALIALPFFLVHTASGRPIAIDRRIILTAVGMLLISILSLAINMDTILGSRQKGEWGLLRWVTSTGVLMFGFYCALLLHAAASADFRKYFLKPLLAVTIFACAVGFVEFASWHSAAIYNAYYVVSHNLFHASVGRGQFVVGRIQSVTFEASSFGALVIMVLPWCYSYIWEKGFRAARLVTFTVIGIFLLCLGSGRTSVSGAIMITAIYFLVAMLVKAGRGRGSAVLMQGLLIAATIIPVAVIALFTDQIVASILSSGSVSNASRFGTVRIMIQLFLGHPILGVGPGQYGFYVTDLIESWAYNWEFRRWIGDAQASFFPSFSVYARLAGELGAVGLGFWTLFLSGLVGRATIAAKWVRAKGVTPRYGVAVITGLFGILVAGWSAGSFKLFGVWVAIGLATAYIAGPMRVERDAE